MVCAVLEMSNDLTIQTTWGSISIKTEQGKVLSCTLPRLDTDPDIPFSVTQYESDEISGFVEAALTGKTNPVPTLELIQGSDFQRRVWDAISEIPVGETCTYHQLAENIGQPSAVRAVSNACGKNPALLFIPCHRIKRSDGGLGGFSAGLAWKRLLLAAEHS